MKTRARTRLRLGRISYLNVLPFYHGLEGNGFGLEPVVGSPTEINQRMHLGELDIAPISSLEYLNHQKDYLLFPDLCLGSRDFSGSVLLLSRERAEGLGGATISLSEESLSAATLLRILLKSKFGFENEFRVDPSRPEEMLSRAKGCLVIGDEALFYQPKEFLYKTDLSEVWWDWTGLPFCFSVWAVRRDFYAKRKEEIRAFYHKLKFNLERNLQDLERLVREGLGLTMVDAKFPVIYGYLFNLSYGFDTEMREGLELFYRRAHELGVSPAAKKLEFIEA